MKIKAQPKTLLFETIACLLILAIFIFILLPTIKLHKKRHQYQAIITAVRIYQQKIEDCFEREGSLIYCNANSNQLPPNITESDQHPTFKELTIKEGKITVTPRSTKHINEEDNLILYPRLLRGKIHWSKHGKSVEKGYAD